MEKLAILFLAMVLLMLSGAAIARMPAGGERDDKIAMVTRSSVDDNNNNAEETKMVQYSNMEEAVKNKGVKLKEIMVIKEGPVIIEEVVVVEEEEENGRLKCAQILEDCFRTPCCSGLRCDLGIHARCV